MITTASPEQTKDIIENAGGFGLQVYGRTPTSGVENVGARTIINIQTCLRCNLVGLCRDATEITGESPEPGNFTCYAVNEGFPLVLVRQ